MSSKWNNLKRELFASYPLCQYCEKEDAWELAHAIIHKRDLPGTKNAKIRDVKENALPVCKSCHPFSETYEGELHAFAMLCKREGEQHMKDWYDGLPLKIKEEMP